MPSLPAILQTGLVPLSKKIKGSMQVAKLNLFLSADALDLQDSSLTHLARRVLFYRILNDLDFDFLPWTDYRGSGIERLHELLADGKGALVASQHFGAYRRFYNELLRRGFRVSLVADSRVAGDLATSTSRHLRRTDLDAAEITRRVQRFQVIDAEKQGSVREIFDALSANRVVLFYLDGNTGTSKPGEAPGENTGGGPATIKSLGHELRVRLGLAEIAHRRGLPIVPVFCRWQSDLRPRFEILPPIPHEKNQPAQAAAQQYVQTFYDLFTDRLKQDPGQFEHLIYFHRWLLGASPLEKAALESSRRSVERRLGSGLAARWLHGKAGSFDLGAHQVLAEAKTGRILVAKAEVSAVAKALSRADEKGLNISLLKSQTRLEERVLVEILATLRASDMIDWAEQIRTNEPAFALSD
ncbi:MAG: hypothetical protein AAF725_02010 [Acidobacteriota bacterium]